MKQNMNTLLNVVPCSGTKEKVNQLTTAGQHSPVILPAALRRPLLRLWHGGVIGLPGPTRGSCRIVLLTFWLGQALFLRCKVIPHLKHISRQPSKWPSLYLANFETKK